MYWETRDSDDPVLRENYKKAKAQHLDNLVVNSKKDFFRRKIVQVPITRELQV